MGLACEIFRLVKRESTQKNKRERETNVCCDDIVFIVWIANNVWKLTKRIKQNKEEWIGKQSEEKTGDQRILFTSINEQIKSFAIN